MRAVASTIILLTLCGFAYAEESKPLATQAGEATAPIAEAIGSGFSRIVTEFMAGTERNSISTLSMGGRKCTASS